MGVRVTIIDSGVNPWHSHVQGLEGGLSFRLSDSGEVEETGDYSDELGHGTAIAGVIREKAPEARLQAFKIFHQDLFAPAQVLLAALERAVRMPSRIIHLSLGTEQPRVRADLARLCKEADDQDIVIVAAARGPEDRVCPASLDSVIGVYWNPTCEEGSLLYHPGTPIEVGAYGRPRSLPGLPQEQNLKGNSFAAARVTALAAAYLCEHPSAGSASVRDMLKRFNTGG
jgi:hypothetical protein